jgi:hypothetical protein
MEDKIAAEASFSRELGGGAGNQIAGHVCADRR